MRVRRGIVTDLRRVRTSKPVKAATEGHTDRQCAHICAHIIWIINIVSTSAICVLKKAWCFFDGAYFIYRMFFVLILWAWIAYILLVISYIVQCRYMTVTYSAHCWCQQPALYEYAMLGRLARGLFSGSPRDNSGCKNQHAVWGVTRGCARHVSF